MKYLLTGLFGLCVLGANWTLERYGFVQLVGPGDITVPAGVYWAGLAFSVRDTLSEVAGRMWVVAAIVGGAVLSYWVEPDFAFASGAAFLVSEAVDFAIYSPLRERRWTTAVIASNVAGSTLDSILFLWLAFDTPDGWADLTYGKILMIVPGLALVWGVRRFSPAGARAAARR